MISTAPVTFTRLVAWPTGNTKLPSVERLLVGAVDAQEDQDDGEGDERVRKQRSDKKPQRQTVEVGSVACEITVCDTVREAISTCVENQGSDNPDAHTNHCTALGSRSRNDVDAANHG